MPLHERRAQEQTLCYLDKQQQKQLKMHKLKRISSSCCGNEPVILKQMGVGGPRLIFLSLHFITLMISESEECNYSVDMLHASFYSLTLLGLKTGQ